MNFIRLFPHNYKKYTRCLKKFPFVYFLFDCFRKAFKNIYDMLKPGGSTFLIFFEKTPIDDLFDRLKTHPKWGKYGQEKMISTYYYSKNTKNDYQKDIEAAQFKDYTFNVEQEMYRFSSEEECDSKYFLAVFCVPF